MTTHRFGWQSIAPQPTSESPVTQLSLENHRMGKLLTVDEAAPMIGLKPASLRSLCHKRLIRYLRIGPGRGLFRFREEWLNEYLESCIVEPEERQAKPKPQPRPSRSANQQARSPSPPKPMETPSERMKRLKREMKERGR